MKFLMLPLFVLPFFVISCGKSDSSGEEGAGDASQNETVEAVASSVQSAGDKAAGWTRSAGYWIADTWDSIKDSTAENTERVKVSLDEATEALNQQIAIATDKASELTGAAKQQVEKGIEGLKKARDEIVDAGSRVSSATAEQWPEVKQEVSEALVQAGQSMKSIWGAATDETESEDSASSASSSSSQ